jgi:hypothetical protein
MRAMRASLLMLPMLWLAAEKRREAEKRIEDAKARDLKAAAAGEAVKEATPPDPG